MDGSFEKSLRPLFLEFLNKLSAQQKRILRDGEPDTATKVMLADLILEIIMAVTKSLVRSFMNLDVDYVQDKLNDALSQAFGELMEIPNQDECKNLTSNLSTVMSSEICRSIQQARSSTSSAQSEPLYEHFTCPRKLNQVIGYASKTFKAFLCKIKQAGSHWLNGELEDSDSDSGSDSFFFYETEQKDTVEKIQVPSQDSFVEATAKAACEIIKSNINNFTENLLSDVPYEDYQQLKAETSEEIARISESIAQSISSMKEADAEASSKWTLNTVTENIRKFFRQSFLKAWLQGMVAKLRNTFDQDSTVACSDSLGSLTESVESLLSTSTSSIPKDRVLIFTEQLSNLLYNYITNGTTIIPPSLRACIPKSHSDMYEDIRRKAWIFILVMSWFQHTQTGSIADNVMLALTSNDSQASAGQPEQSVPEPVSQQDPEEFQKMDKVFVEILVRKLMTRIFRKAKMDWK